MQGKGIQREADALFQLETIIRDYGSDFTD